MDPALVRDLIKRKLAATYYDSQYPTPKIYGRGHDMMGGRQCIARKYAKNKDGTRNKKKTVCSHYDLNLPALKPKRLLNLDS